MKHITFSFASLALICLPICTAQADIFGSGSNTFEIEFVFIGDPGNIADTTGSPTPAGSVDYGYRMSKFEVSEEMISKANALGGLGITQINRGPNKPATSINWFEAAGFVNWLNESTDHSPAYKFDGSGIFQLWQSGDAGYDPNNLYRNSQARYFLPSDDEWYKAAYYDPTNDVYYNYPTGSDVVPLDTSGGTMPGTAVYAQSTGPTDITLAGGLSPYGTMAQGGNAWEWEETEIDLVNDSPFASRGLRGGSWAYYENFLNAAHRDDDNPADGGSNVGFRVASTPEPSSALLILIGTCLAGLQRRFSQVGGEHSKKRRKNGSE